MKWMIVFLLVPSLAWSQGYERQQLDRIEQQQRTIIGTMRDAEMREEFRQSSERMNQMANEPARLDQAQDRANRERDERFLQENQRR